MVVSVPAVVAILGALSSAALGAVVFAQRRDIQGKSFAVLCAAVAVWNLYFAALYALPCGGELFSILNILRVGPSVVPAAVLHLAFVSGGERPRWARIVLLLAVAASALLVLANPFGYVVAGLRELPFGCYSVPGPLYHLYTLEVCACFGTAWWLWLRDLQHAENPEQRLAARLWLVGALIAFTLGLTNLLPVYGIPMYPLGNLGSAVWVALIAYGILEHRLLDIDALLWRGTALVLSALAVALPAALLVVGMQLASFGKVHSDFTAVLALVVLTAVVAGQWVHARAERAAERRLAARKLEQRLTFDAVVRLALRQHSRDRLFEAAAQAIELVFRPPAIVIGYRVNPHERIELSLRRGIPPVDSHVAADSPLVQCLATCDTSLLPGELEEQKDANAQAAASFLRRNQWAVCVPFKTGQTVVGFLAIGLKNGVDFYSADELQALERLGWELALALDNLHMREEVAIAQEAVFRSDRLSSLGTMVAAVVHEVRNPLVSLSTFVQLAEGRVADRQFFESSVPVVRAELDRVGKLLDALLSYTRAHKAVVAPVSLNTILERVRLLLAPHAKRFGVKLVVDERPDGPVVEGDEDRLVQVVFNLVMNAVEASPKGGTVRVEWDRVFRAGDYFGVVRVVDQGRGVPPAQRSQIFLPFFTTKAKGSGLGLSVSKQIIEEHHGFLEVGDAPGGGAVFTMGVPVYVEARKGAVLAEAAVQVGLLRARDGRGTPTGETNGQADDAPAPRPHQEFAAEIGQLRKPSSER